MSEGTTGLTNFRKGFSVIFFSDCDVVAKINAVLMRIVLRYNNRKLVELTAWSFMGSASLITKVCCEAVRSAILATAWLLVLHSCIERERPLRSLNRFEQQG